MQIASLDKYFETDGVRLRYRDDGQGAAVIFVHGWTLDLDAWEAQAAALAKEYRVVRLDRRGFGLSSGHPSLAGDVADLLALCAHLRLDSVAVVGMSQGARAVMQFARIHAHMITCVILDGPPSLGAQGPQTRPPDVPYQRYCELAQTQGLDEFRREWCEHPLTRLRNDDPQVQALVARMIARYPGKDLLDAAPAVAATPGIRDSQVLNRPVLLINGALDLESRKHFAEQLARELPRVEHFLIPDAGHLCNLDNPASYNEVVRGFLRRHAAAAGQK